MPETMSPCEKVELKPCPFCGGEAEKFSMADRVGIRCADVMCAGSHRLPSAGEDAAAAWNRRAALASSGDHAELARLKAAMSKSNDEICQSLGKALGYPWFKDDQRNFPGATEENGVCVGEHVAESIADEAASRISALLAENAALRAERDDYFGMANRSEDAWHKAERKLAEADRLLERIANDPTWDGPSSARLYFLSKEAERG